RRAIDAGRGNRHPPAHRGPYYEVEPGPRDFSLEEIGPGDYNAWQDRMPTFDLDAYVARSGALDLDAIAWDEVPRPPLPLQAVRTLRYMQDIESHTIIYLR